MGCYVFLGPPSICISCTLQRKHVKENAYPSMMVDLRRSTEFSEINLPNLFKITCRASKIAATRARDFDVSSQADPSIEACFDRACRIIFRFREPNELQSMT